MNILSLGAGVQSSTLALMAAQGEIGPMPDAAIFADTGWEPKAVHDYLNWLEPLLPFPVYRVHLDRLIRNRASKMQSAQYMHRSLVPIDQVEFGENNLDMWGNECEGMCGL